MDNEESIYSEVSPEQVKDLFSYLSGNYGEDANIGIDIMLSALITLGMNCNDEDKAHLAERIQAASDLLSGKDSDLVFIQQIQGTTQ